MSTVLKRVENHPLQVKKQHKIVACVAWFVLRVLLVLAVVLGTVDVYNGNKWRVEAVQRHPNALQVEPPTVPPQYVCPHRVVFQLAEYCVERKQVKPFLP